MLSATHLLERDLSLSKDQGNLLGEETLELRRVGWVGADSVAGGGGGVGEGAPGGRNSTGGESDGEGLKGMGAAAEGVE